MSSDKTDSIFNCFPRSMHENVRAYLNEASAKPEIRHSHDEYYIGSQRVLLPGRVYSEATDDSGLGIESKIIHYCLLSRHHDGHVREFAVVWLVNNEPPSWAYAFILAALGDYVSSIVRVVCTIKDKELLAGLKMFAYSQTNFSAVIRARIVSYWNEYYRTKDIRSYEPYTFMESLVSEETRDWRQPTQYEKALLIKLLTSDFPGVETLRKQIADLLVAPLDNDGCISLKPTVNEKANVKTRVPVTLRATKDSDNPVEILLFVDNGIAAEMEVVRFGPDDDYPLPPLDDFEVVTE